MIEDDTNKKNGAKVESVHSLKTYWLNFQKVTEINRTLSIRMERQTERQSCPNPLLLLSMT